jgi:hypothetical protein
MSTHAEDSTGGPSLAAVALYGLAVAAARAGWEVDLWPSLGVNSAPTLFYDARNVAAAADCWALGYDPLVDNPCDPAGRVMVYPRVWAPALAADQG